MANLHEVKSYFDNNDTHLGMRRLLDAAIETGNSNVFQHTLNFCDWYDINHKKENFAGLNERVSSLIDIIGNAPPLPAKKEDQLALKADGISKRYAHGNFSLSKLNVHLPVGKITGLVGENGNGKTTLLRVLYGELQPDTGTINYHLTQTPNPESFYETKTRLAFIPQRPNAWYGSLMDNLQFAAAHYGMKGKENYLWTEMIIARMGLRPFRTYTWSRISSGYKMRFELARTLIKKPEILLLDEPLANLDVLAQQIILEDLKYMSQSTTHPLSIILSSQQLYEVEKVSEQVIFLQKGVAKYQQTNTPLNTADETPQQLVMELETAASRETLQQVLGGHGLEKISFNGGVYILYFNSSISSYQLLQVMGENKLQVKYFRDISSSSRRFFDA